MQQPCYRSFDEFEIMETMSFIWKKLLFYSTSSTGGQSKSH